MHLILLMVICLIEILSNIGKADDKRRKMKTILMGLCIFLFAALRGEGVGYDVLSYVIDYSRVINRSMTEVIAMNYRDPAFPVLMKILSYISKDPQILLIIIAAFEAIGFSFLAYSFGEPFLLFVLFITLRIYPFTLSALRQTISLSFVWLAIPQLKKNKFITFAVLVIVGSLFHSSAIIALLLIPLYKLNRTVLTSVMALFIGLTETVGGGLFTKMFNEYVFSGRYSGYIGRAAESKISLTSTFYIYVLFFILYIVYYKQLNGEDAMTPFYFRATCIGIMFSLIGQGFPNMFRISYYFIIFLMAKVENVINIIFAQNSRKLAIWIVALILIAQYIYFGPGAGTDIYSFFWQY